MPRLLLMMIVMMMVAPQGMHAQTTCGAVTRLSSRITYITCIFQQDISDDNFNVQFLPGDGANPETALACNKNESGGLYCHMAGGVEFDEHQKMLRRFTFTRDVTFNRVGSQYKCHVVPSSEQDSMEPCSVVEIDIPEEKATPPCPVPDHCFPISVAIFILVFIMFIAIIVTVVGCVIAYIKRERIVKWLSDHLKGFEKREDIEELERNIPPNNSKAQGPEMAPATQSTQPQQKAEEEEMANEATGMVKHDKPQKKGLINWLRS